MRAEWSDGFSKPALGAMFMGHNVNGDKEGSIEIAARSDVPLSLCREGRRSVLISIGSVIRTGRSVLPSGLRLVLRGPQADRS